MILTSSQLYKKVQDEFHNAGVYLTDVSYVTPDRNWLQGKFYSTFRRNLTQNKLYQWRTYHDCDNKANKYWQFACDCHALTMMLREKQGKQIYEGIAVGVFFFKQETRFGHAVNFAVTEKGIEFIEPQNGRFITLTQDEKDTAWYAIF
jgi:hypothetical protein